VETGSRRTAFTAEFQCGDESAQQGYANPGLPLNFCNKKIAEDLADPTGESANLVRLIADSPKTLIVPNRVCSASTALFPRMTS